MSERSFPTPGDADATLAELVRLSGLLDEIGVLEEQVAALQAVQVLRTAEFLEGTKAVNSSRFGWSSQTQTLAAMEVAGARKISLAAAERYLDHAARLVDDLPAVLGVLEAGLTSLDAVRAVAGEVQALLPGSLALADEIIADDLIGAMPGQVRSLARTRVLEIDPDAGAVHAARNRSDRWVGVRESGALGMATLTGFLPAEQALACHQVLDRDARTARHDGDARTVAQIMADTLVERVTGQATASSVPVTVSLVMSDLTLLGLDDRPAQATGGGPIPAPVARWLACHDSTWVRRLYTDPVDATVAVVDTGQRRYDGALRALCLARDQHCRAPGCRHKIRHLDHTLDYHDTGPTTASNGRGYCEHCHRTKHHPTVDVETIGLGTAAIAGHDAYTRWTMPTGRVHPCLPPPALGHGTTTRDQTTQRRHLTHQTAATTTDTVWPHLNPNWSRLEQRLRDLFTLAS